MPITVSLSACRFWDYLSLIKSWNSWKPLEHLKIIAITTARIKYILKKKYPSKIVLNWCEFKGNSYLILRWLDRAFQGQYVPISGINKDLEISPPQLYYIKMKILLWSGYHDIGVVIATKWRRSPFLLAAVFLGTGNCSSKIVHGGFFL